MLNNKKTAFGFICIGFVAIIVAIFGSVFFRRTYSTDIPKALDEAVAYSAFVNQEVSLSDITIDGRAQTYAYAPVTRSNFECMGEGHLILGYLDKGKSVEVYALCSTIGYGFRNGMLVDNTGSFCIPTLIVFDKSENGQYIFREARETMDGGLFESSVRKMFPAELAEKAISAQGDNEISSQLHRQCDVYAAAYLKAIEREAKISSYHDESFAILRDYGVSADVSNALLKLRSEYDIYLGNFETLEADGRYVYSVKWDGDDNGTGTVTYTKTQYDTKKVVEKFAYKVEGDEYSLIKPKKKK